MNLPVLFENYDDMIHEIKTDKTFTSKTLFLKGANSGYIVETDEPLIKKLFPQASIITIANAGHWIHADNPEAFYKTIFDFFRS